MIPIRVRTACLMAVALLAGCHKDSSSASTTPVGAPTGGPGPVGAAGPTLDADSGPHAAGKKALVSHGCFRCHSVNGARPGGGPGGPGGPPKFGGGGRKGPGAPDLGHAGQDPTHTVDWLTRFIANPKEVKPDSKMPAFQGKLSEDDLRAMAEYLASLK